MNVIKSIFRSKLKPTLTLIGLVAATASAWSVPVTHVDDDWTGTGLGVDPDGAGPATAFGTDAFDTVQGGVDGVDADGTVNVSPGTYMENVLVNKNLSLLSTGGRAVTTIEGDSAAAGLGAIQVSNNTSAVRIGDTGQGFTIVGIDKGAPGVENAAIYFQGGHSGAQICDNEIVANGEAGLLTEYGATIIGFLIDGNEFSGQTFLGAQPAGIGFGSQFTTPNVPRQLVAMGNGGGSLGTALATVITFTNNDITGISGGISSDDSVSEQGNGLVTLDVASSTISGNTFNGTTTRFGAALRCRRPDTAITGNDFVSTNMGLGTEHMFLQNNTTPIQTIVGANTFDRGAYVDDTSDLSVSLQGGIGRAAPGATVNVLSGTYDEGPQIVLSKDVDLVGQGVATTIVRATADTGTGGDSRGWFLVDAGVTANVSNIAFDGNGFLIWQAFRHRGSGTFDNVSFNDIQFNPSGPHYNGNAIAVFGGSSDVDVTNSSFTNIGRIGVLYFGAGTTGTFSGNTYVGKGAGDHLDYCLDVSAGATLEIAGNTISGNRGVASVDGSTSAGLLVSTFFAAGTSANIHDNDITDNTTGVFVGFNSADTSDVIVRDDTTTGNDTGVRVVGTANVLLEGTDLNGNSSEGLRVTGGGIVDAGQVGGTDFTGLGISAGGNDFGAYLPAGPAVAIRNENTNTPNDLAGAQGAPDDLTAQANVFFCNDLADVEMVVDHDADDSSQGFVDFSSAVSSGLSDCDGDGFTVAEGDCDDDNPNIFPGAEEIVGNGIDENCDGFDTPRPTPAGPELVDFTAAGGGSPVIRGGGAPGGPKGTSFFTLNHAFINNSGEVLVEANLTGGAATENLGLWSDGGGGGLALVALEGAGSIGTEFAGTTYKSFGRIALNDTGLVDSSLLVQGGGTTSATDRGTFSELVTGTLTGGMREGSTAPGAGTAVFSILQDPALGETLLAHPGQLKIDAGAGVGGTNDRGIWSSDGTADSLVIREGGAVTAAGIGGGVTFGQIENRIVASGDDNIAFSSLVQGNGGANKVILAGQPGNLRLIAARNDVIDGAQISSFAAESLNDAGDVAFRAILAGEPAASNGAIFTNIAGTNTLIAQEGEQAPGQIAGVLFDRFADLHLLDGGDLVFFAYLRGTVTSSSNDGVIYRYDDSAGTMAAVVREGDLAVGTDGGVINLLGNFDANALGGVVYTATLAIGIGDVTTADNLGVWLSQDSSVPAGLQARKGDEFVYQPGTGKGDPDDIRTITSLAIDRVSNPLGGVGSTPKVINDSGQAIIRVSNTLGGGAFVIGIVPP